MKTYRSPRNVVAEVKQLIAADKPSPRPPSALVRVLKLLCESRNYERAGVFLAVDGREVPRAFSGTAASESGPELSVPIKIASQTLGSLRAQLPSGHVFSPEERILLHAVAEALALYLTGKGKYLVRKAREALHETGADSGETRGYQPSSEKADAMAMRVAVAGDRSRS